MLLKLLLKNITKPLIRGLVRGGVGVVALANVTAPVASIAIDGLSASVTDGSWTATPDSFTYQWMLNGVDIAGATSDTYNFLENDLGEGLTVEVTATKGAEVVAAVSNSVTPTTNITGYPFPGETLTAAGAGQWYADGVAISGQTGATYVVELARVGQKITQAASVGFRVLWHPNAELGIVGAWLPGDFLDASDAAATTAGTEIKTWVDDSPNGFDLVAASGRRGVVLDHATGLKVIDMSADFYTAPGSEAAYKAKPYGYIVALSFDDTVSGAEWDLYEHHLVNVGKRLTQASRLTYNIKSHGNLSTTPGGTDVDYVYVNSTQINGALPAASLQVTVLGAEWANNIRWIRNDGGGTSRFDSDTMVGTIGLSDNTDQVIQVGGSAAGVNPFYGPLAALVMLAPSRKLYDFEWSRIEKYFGLLCGRTYAYAYYKLASSDWGNTLAPIDRTTYFETTSFATTEWQTRSEWLLLESRSTNATGFDILIYVDDVFLAAVTAVNSNPYKYAGVALPSGDKKVTIVNPSQQIGGASVPTGQWISALHFSKPAQVIAPDTSYDMAVMGTSIVAGYNADNFNECWVLQAKETLGWTMAIDASGGDTFFRNAGDSTKRAAYVARLVAKNPARLWIELSTNDFFFANATGQNVAQFETAYAAFLVDVHTALPDCEIYAQQAILRGNQEAVTNSYGEIIEDYRDAVANAASGKAYVTLVAAKNWVLESDIDTDQVHPTQSGHDKIAAQFIDIFTP